MKLFFFICLFMILCQCRGGKKPSPVDSPSDVSPPGRTDEPSPPPPPARQGVSGEDHTVSTPLKSPETERKQTHHSLCERTPQVQKAILLQIKQKGCKEVSKRELALVQELNLTKKSITTLKPFDFEGLAGLKKLSLHHNQIELLPPGVFSHLTSLEYLSLANNKIKILGLHVFKDLKQLKTLIFSSNRLGSAVLFNGAFSGLLSLRVLYLNGNKIKILPASFFKGLTVLKELYLYSNKIHFLPVGLFYDTPALRILDISYNRLTSDSLHKFSFSNLSDLEKLNLEGNRISMMTSFRLREVWGDKLNL